MSALDEALAAVAADRPASGQRQALLGLGGLRRALFANAASPALTYRRPNQSVLAATGAAAC